MMSEIAGAAWVLPLTFALQGLSAALILIRLIRGPHATDRVVAIDALSMIGIGVIALLALATAQAVLLDAAVVLALVSFLGTTAFIPMFRRRGRGPDERVTTADTPLPPAAAAPVPARAGRNPPALGRTTEDAPSGEDTP